MPSGLLPIGTVVLLKNSTKRVMIIGVCQRSSDNPQRLWEYSGCLFPEGYMGADKVFLFNRDRIDQIFHLGLQDEEQNAFRDRVNQMLEEYRKS